MIVYDCGGFLGERESAFFYRRNIMIFISKSIFLKRFKNEMLVVDTYLHNTFILNDIAADIVEYIYKKREVDISTILRQFEDIDDYEINTFLNELVALQIVFKQDDLSFKHGSNGNAPYKTDDIEADFQLNFIKEQKLYAALVELTYRCNLRCSHCYAVESESAKRELTTSDIINLFDELYDNGIFRLTLTGGEIFVRNDILQIIEYAYKKGFLIDLFSNATLLNEEIVKKLVDFHIRSFQVSIYSHKPEIHDAITGIKGSFERSVNALRLLKKYHISTNIKSVMMERNFQDYEGIEKLANDLGASFQTSLYIIPHNNGSKENLKNRIQNSRDIRNIIIQDLKRTKAISFYRKRSESDTICNAGYSAISIDPYGNIYPCNLLKIKLGNFKKEKISDIWTNSELLNKIRQYRISDLKQCSTCDKLEYCFFCPGAALAEKGNMLLPYEEACLIAGLKKDLDTKNMQ